MTDEQQQSIVRGIIIPERQIFYKDNFGIYSCSVSEDLEGEFKVNHRETFTLKGQLPNLIIGQEYDLKAEETEDPKYGMQYNNICIALNVKDIETDGKEKFLKLLYTQTQLEQMHITLDDPFETLKNEDSASLVQVKGCGIKTAVDWIERFKNHYDLIRVYTELSEYNLTNSIIKKLTDFYRSPELVIQNVKENPYILCEVGGIGWSIADRIAMKGGLEEFGIERVGAYIKFYLTTQAQNGFSYVSTDELMGCLIEAFTDDIPDINITNAIHSIGDKLWWNKDKTYIGLSYYRQLEEKIGKELMRLKAGKSNITYDNWEDVIKKTEEDQGWKYTEQQCDGIKLALEENVTVIHGKAGTGKSATVNGVLNVLKSKNLKVAMCALSGKAAARLTETTSGQGQTIHRLLGFPAKGDEGKNGFGFHDENKLSYDIVIVDEISMIGGSLFYYLLRAIRTGSKLILIGDIGQLESIGECKVAADVIESPYIPTIFLDKIHRQAAKSAIITESIAVRDGKQIIPKDFVGSETRGELQDLHLDIYSDRTNTFYKCMQHVAKELETIDNIFDLQVICPIKSSGDACTWNFNIAIQELYNPHNKKKNEIIVYYPNGKNGILREGDKVMNVSNNYKTTNPDNGKITPIFNGNMGVIYNIDTQNRSLIIDFYDIGRVLVKKQDIAGIELGYASTTHKQQGNQAKIVIYTLDYSSYTMLSREQVYTGVTRAQKKCIIVAQNSALRYATANEKISQKNSHLVSILEELQPKKIDF